MLAQLCKHCARRQAQVDALKRSLASSTLTWPPPQGVLDAQPELAALLQPTTAPVAARPQKEALGPVQQSILELAQAVRKQELAAPTLPALMQLQVKQLQGELRKHQEPTSGLKVELVQRLLDLFHRAPIIQLESSPTPERLAPHAAMSRSQRFFDSPQQVSQAWKPQGQAAVKATEFNYWQVVDHLKEAKCDDVLLLDVSQVCDFTSSFVVATCRSQRHVASAAAGLAYVARKQAQGGEQRPLPVVDGRTDSDWQVVDLGDTVAHLLLEEARSHYAIEKKWQHLLGQQHPPERVWDTAVAAPA